MPFLYWLLIIAAAVFLLAWAFGRPARVRAGGDPAAVRAPDADRGNLDARFQHDAARRDAEVAEELAPPRAGTDPVGPTGGVRIEPELDATVPPDSAAATVLGEEDRAREAADEQRPG